MHLRSLSHFTVLDASPADVVSIAADAMLDAVGLRLHPDPLFPNHPPDGTPSVSSPNFKEVCRRLTDTGLAVLDVEVVRLLPDTEPDHYVPLMEMATGLGAAHVVVTGSDPDEVRTIDNFGKLCALAEPFGLNMMLEFVRYGEVKSMAQAYKIITASGAGNGKILIDSLHFFRAGETPDRVGALDPSLFPYIQISDGPLLPPEGDGFRIEGRSNRLFPGEGGLPLAELVNALPSGIPLTVEVANDDIAQKLSPAERAQRAADSLNAFIAGLNYS
jgi:sugar phosphate isomerase/epimerase